MIKALNQEVIELTELFRDCKPGNTITLEQMTRHIKRDINMCPWHIQSARRRAMKLYQVVLIPVRGVGYKRLENDEIPQNSMRYVKRAHRLAKRGIAELASTNYDELKPENKIEHNLQMSLLGAISYSTQSSQLKKIRGAVQSTGLCLPVPNALDAIK